MSRLITSARDLLPRVLVRRLVSLVAWAFGLVLAVEMLFGRARTTSVMSLPVPTGVSLGVLLNGAILGMLYALLAFGLILVYRANRIVNFAHAGLGLVPAVTALLLVTNHHWPYLAAVIVMLVGSALTGALCELVMRRFWSTPRMVATVFTIGLAQLFVYFELQLPIWIADVPVVPLDFPSPYAGLQIEIGGIVFNGDYLAIVVATVLVCLGLASFLKFTRMGIAVRASAENADRAAVLGVPVQRLSTIVWVLAAMCSGIAVFLQAPVTSLSAGGTISPLILLYGLAAAIVARMESLPIALAAGMGIGVIQQGAFVGSSRPDDAAALMLLIIVAALLLQRRRMARAYDTGVVSFKSLQELRPIPVALRSLPEVRLVRAVLAVACTTVALAAPLVAGSKVGFCVTAVIAGIVAVSLVVLSGWAGQISLGQFGFVGVGAAVAGGLATRYNIDFFVTLAAAMAAGALIAMVIGLPALRVPGLFLAVVTLGFAATVRYGVLSRDRFGWLLPPDGVYVERPLLYGQFDLARPGPGYYYVCLLFLVLACLSARSLRRSRTGRLLVGLRDNVRSAQSYGANPTSTRLAAFAISGAMASLAGALSAYQSQVDPGSFSMDASLMAFLYAVVGGVTSLPGAVAATIGFSALNYFGGERLSVLATGVGVSLVLLVFPGGFAQIAQQARDGALRYLALRRGLPLPLEVTQAADPETAQRAGAQSPRRPTTVVQHVASGEAS